MTSATSTTPSVTTTDDTLDPTIRLERSLHELVQSHERLLELTVQHRAAIARSSAPELDALVRAQHTEIKRIAELEQHRRQAVRELVGGLPRRAPQPTIETVLQRVAGEVRERIGGLAERLRGLLTRLQRERAIVQRATASLVSHMEGLMRQVAASLSPSGAYAASGRVEAPRQPIAAGLDVTS
ncbi:MAG: flagellar export chaperone FlgN [Planctomycetota bacterium]